MRIGNETHRKNQLTVYKTFYENTAHITETYTILPMDYANSSARALARNLIDLAWDAGETPRSQGKTEPVSQYLSI